MDCARERHPPQFSAGLISWGKAGLGKVAPFAAATCIQHVPVVLFDARAFPSYVGLLVELLWLIGPVFVITTTCSWWFYRNTRSVWPGGMFNTFVMACVASAVFPF